MKENAGTLIKEKRKYLGLTQENLSNLTKINIELIDSIENNKVEKIPLSVGIKLSKLLKIDLMKLIEPDEEFLVISKYFHEIYYKEKRGD